MRSSIATSATILFLGLIGLSPAQEPGEWSNFDKCQICKPMMEIEGLMECMKCEMKPLENGLISVTSVPNEMKPALEKANKEMERVIAKVTSGEKMDMCGYCKSMGTLHMAGAKIQKFHTDIADIMIVTSDDQKVVKLIHEHLERANELKAKFEAQARAKQVSQK